MSVDSTDTNVVVVGFVKLAKDTIFVPSMYSASGRRSLYVTNRVTILGIQQERVAFPSNAKNYSGESNFVGCMLIHC